MIGIIVNKDADYIVREFFELFKTPWEYYDKSKFYDVVIATEDLPSVINTKMAFICTNRKLLWDETAGIEISSQAENIRIQYDQMVLPLYRRASFLQGKGTPVIGIKGSSEIVGLQVASQSSRVVRLGYDLFDEIQYLFSVGQPAKYSANPTFDFHVSIIRDLILSCGIPLIEIPPVPAGYSSIACLTHDVDFTRIRDHKFDHTILGFLYRAVFGSIVGLIKNRSSWQRLTKNWIAALKLPGVYCGIVADYFYHFYRYREIEKEMPSTFFVIPFKNYPGQFGSKVAPKKRACRYGVEDISGEIKYLVDSGADVDLHGIDAWFDPVKGKNELEKISKIIGKPSVGIRMHWLYFKKESPRILEKAGFVYDSTFGYNDAVGYRAGTAQAFVPDGARKLLELPLVVQDTALFYGDRMNLSESSAWALVEKLFGHLRTAGGTMTINWHHRSLGPERLWDEFYIKLLEAIRNLNCWVATANSAVSWYWKRRTVSFKSSDIDGDRIRLKLGGYQKSQVPDVLIRVHNPASQGNFSEPCHGSKFSYSDFQLKGRKELNINLR